ncbi:hypothetical protein B9Z65_5499 [Elsinoe australis]|uniref:AB hydrolase-1 domain-containing protein n=1 Tax=Elsinoe australis TaxID=40998 RepID=A0A2P7ZED9_9PEZI|nr:hypothetical protein B9Z65_5499 [Elsinoe australis]
MSHKPVWILVPGALHPGPLYQPLLDEIAKHGYETLALTNPSLAGPDQKKLTCSDDANHARGKILQYLDQDRDVVVVCHSYGGMVSGAAVYGLSKKERLAQGEKAGVVGHIYLSAVLDVKSIGNEVEMHPPSFLELNHPHEGLFLANDEETAIKAFYMPEVEPEHAKELASRIRPQSILSVMSPPEGKPSWIDPNLKGKIGYIRCLRDQTLDLDLQDKFILASGQDWHIADIDTGHSPFASRPAETAEICLSLLRKFEASG